MSNSEKQLSDLTITIEGVSVSIPAPYCTPSEWGKRIGVSERAVKRKLEAGDIARYQGKAYGSLFVNVVQEIRKSVQAKPY